MTSHPVTLSCNSNSMLESSIKRFTNQARRIKTNSAGAESLSKNVGKLG